MGDDGKELKKEETQELKPIVLSITLTPDGRVNITGPIKDRLLCYGMLKMAEEIIYDFKNAQKVDLILPKKHNIMDFIRRK
jgi:hypothetical protein